MVFVFFLPLYLTNTPTAPKPPIVADAPLFPIYPKALDPNSDPVSKMSETFKASPVIAGKNPCVGSRQERCVRTGQFYHSISTAFSGIKSPLPLQRANPSFWYAIPSSSLPSPSFGIRVKVRNMPKKGHEATNPFRVLLFPPNENFILYLGIFSDTIFPLDRYGLSGCVGV